MGAFYVMLSNVTLRLLFWLGPVAGALCAGSPDQWVPARWDGGPAELGRRAQDKAVTANASVREAIAGWYNPATLELLEGTPINCLLVTFRGGASSEVEPQQQKLVREYARLARQRGIAVLGIVHPEADAGTVAASALEAKLDGLVIEGEFPGGSGFAARVEAALRSNQSAAVVISIASDAASVRTSKAPVLAVEGVRPSSRHPMQDGIRATPTTEPWIESNIWLVRSFRLGTAWRPIWVSQEPKANSRAYYIKSVADAAVAGGRWIVALDDDLRASLFRRDPDALATWRNLGTYLRFAEDHAEWRNWTPYGNLGVVLDTAGKHPEISNEYLNLVARRQVPYRLIERSQLNTASLASFQAVLAADVAPPTEAERTVLRAFAEKGGLVVAGPLWGDPPKDDPFSEIPLGKGRVVICKDDPPDPESVDRGMLDLLGPEVMGLTTFNVPSVLTYASTSDSGRHALIQLLNYADRPFESRITIRFNGSYRKARLYTPENPPLDLPVQPAATGGTQVAIPKLGVWGAVFLE
jgi:hypothetical protein